MLRNGLFFIAGALLVTAIVVALKITGQPAPSPYVSEPAQRALKTLRNQLAPHMVKLLSADIDTRRAILDEHFFAPRITTARALYPVHETQQTIAGIYTEVFEPKGGVAPEQQHKVLINLHGGAFSMGARTEGRLESIPVAAVSGLKVISIDYRQGPEHRFPAASEDVAAVYQHLLTQYEPENIGIFGCSAGGLLTAQALAWFDHHDLPMPGAAGIFCAGAGNFGQGDSTAIAALFGSDTGGNKTPAYLAEADEQSSLANPMVDPALMARFPPTLLISSTRDFAMSATLATHQQLTALGATSELHIYEGLIHYFFADTELEESQQAFAVMSRFFHQHLGKATPALSSLREVP